MNNKLLASAFTVAGDVSPGDTVTTSPHSLEERCRAAAKAGYVGIGLSIDDLKSCITKYGYKTTSTIISEAGLQYLEFEVLTDWFASGNRRKKSDEDRKLLIEAAGTLGAFNIKVSPEVTNQSWPIEQVTEEFGKMALEFQKVGAQVALEVFPEGNVTNLASGLKIVEGAAVSTGGLLLDIWHMTRGDIPYEQIAHTSADYIKHIELNDAGPAEGSIMDDTLLGRKLPGEGIFDIPKFLRSVAATGYDGLYGVEILSSTHRQLDPQAQATFSYNATVSQFEKI